MKQEIMFQHPRSVIEMVSIMPLEIQNLLYHPSENYTADIYKPQCFTINFIGKSEDTSSGSCSADTSSSTPYGISSLTFSEERQVSVHNDNIYAAEQCNTSQKCNLENVCKVKSPITLSYNKSAH